MAQKPRTIDSMGRVKCPKCGEWKYFDEYYKNKNTKLGISWQCKVCAKEYQKKFYPIAKRKRQAAKEGAALLDLQEYQGEMTLPPQDHLPDGYIEVPGVGICKVLPDEDQERIRNESLVKADEARRAAHETTEGEFVAPPNEKTVVPEGTPEAERKAYRRFRKELSTKSNDKIMSDFGYIGQRWNDDPTDWDMLQCALWDEALARDLIHPDPDTM